MSVLSFAVVGTGRIAADYLHALDRVAELELVGVADRRRDAVGPVGERWSCETFASAAALLAATRPDAVLVAVPPVDHEPVVLECLAAGAHVLAEKPFALSTKSGERMFAAAQARQRLLTMSAKFRHVRDVIEAKARIESGALGTLVFAHNVFAAEVPMGDRWNSDLAVSGGGVVIDSATHSVDLLRYLFGPIEWVQAVRAPAAQTLAVEDSARLTVGFATGPLASVDVSWSVSTRSPWYLEVHGTDGSLRLGWRGSVLERKGEARPRDLSAGDSGGGYDKVDALGRQLRNFARGAAGDEKLLLEQVDVLASVAVIEAANTSLASEGARVGVRQP